MKLDTGSNTQVDTLRFGLSQLKDVDFDVPATPYVVVSLHRYENIFDRDRLVRRGERRRRADERCPTQRHAPSFHWLMPPDAPARAGSLLEAWNGPRDRGL